MPDETQSPVRLWSHHPVGWGIKPPDVSVLQKTGAKRFRPPRPRAVRPRPLLSELSPRELQHISRELRIGYDALLARADGPNIPPAPINPTSLLHHQAWHRMACHSAIGNIHADWRFLAWHRGFLYFHERILQAILGEKFRLPVWDWDNNANPPALYRGWEVSRLGVPAQAWSYPNIQAEIYSWLQPQAPFTFLGGKPDDTRAFYNPWSATLVHEHVHSQAGGLMTDSNTSALDPIFYAHHANVDRFWEFLRRRVPHCDDPEWLDLEYHFFDETLTEVFVKGEDLVDIDALGYCYLPLPDAQYLKPMEFQSQKVSSDSGEISFIPVTIPEIDSEVKDPVFCLVTGRIGGLHHRLRYLLELRVGRTGKQVYSKIVASFGVFSGAGHTMKMGDEHSIGFNLPKAFIPWLRESGWKAQFWYGPANDDGLTIRQGEALPFTTLISAMVAAKQ